jgi:hypothetical protein
VRLVVGQHGSGLIATGGNFANYFDTEGDLYRRGTCARCDLLMAIDGFPTIAHPVPKLEVPSASLMRVILIDIQSFCLATDSLLLVGAN